MIEKLAVNGGAPVRRTPLPTNMLGAALIGKDEMEELKQVVEQKSPFRHYGLGEPLKVRTFEEEARIFLGCKHALAVSSGSGALFCAAAALGIGPGDEVILPSFGWHSDYGSIVCHGATPVFAAIDDSLNISPADIENKITEKTKAVIIVHYQGGSGRLEKSLKIARDNNLSVIEDCAQALGGEYNGRKLGTFGDIGITSFQANKIITCGEGGLLYTDSEEYFARAARYHDNGVLRKCFAETLEDKSLAAAEKMFAGHQYRMSELQGAFALAQLRKLPAILAGCRKHHARIRNELSECKAFSFRPGVEGDCGITVFLKFKNRSETALFARALSAEGIRIGASSGCPNLLETELVISKNTYIEGIPPYPPGSKGLSPEESDTSKRTNEILGLFAGLGIGATHSDQDTSDIIAAVKKVDRAVQKEGWAHIPAGD